MWIGRSWKDAAASVALSTRHTRPNFHTYEDPGEAAKPHFSLARLVVPSGSGATQGICWDAPFIGPTTCNFGGKAAARRFQSKQPLCMQNDDASISCVSSCAVDTKTIATPPPSWAKKIDPEVEAVVVTITLQVCQRLRLK